MTKLDIKDEECEAQFAQAWEERAAAAVEMVREQQKEERVHTMAHLEEVLDILCGTGPPHCCVCRMPPPSLILVIRRIVRCGGHPVGRGVNVIVHSLNRR